MSKINAVRFINLNYNNNAMKINDECMQFSGKSTLLSLRNGGRQDGSRTDDDGSFCA